MANTNPRILSFVPQVQTESTRHVFSACGSSCPRCKASVFRVSRRFVDLLLSLIVPIRRYRCISMACNWEGNLREKRASLPSIARTLL